MRENYYKGQKNLISETLKELRIRHRVTQEELASRMQILGVSIDQKAISRIEHNDRVVTDYELLCFCRALRCTERDLLRDFYEKFENASDTEDNS